VRLAKNEHQTPEFTQINPLRQVPALLEVNESDGEDRFTLRESHAIMRYLCSTHGQPQNLYSADNHIRGKTDQYLDWAHTWLRASSNRLVFLRYFTELRGQNLSAEKKAADIAQVEEKVQTSLDLIENMLVDSLFLASNLEPTLADLSAICDIT